MANTDGPIVNPSQENSAGNVLSEILSKAGAFLKSRFGFIFIFTTGLALLFALDWLTIDSLGGFGSEAYGYIAIMAGILVVLIGSLIVYETKYSDLFACIGFGLSTIVCVVLFAFKLFLNPSFQSLSVSGLIQRRMFLYVALHLSLVALLWLSHMHLTRQNAGYRAVSEKVHAWINNRSVATKKAMLSGSALILLYTEFVICNPLFLQATNQINLLQQVVTYSIIGYGLTFCLICGGTDLSAGASLALSGIMVVWMLQVGVPMWAAIIIALSMGIFTGILNGFTIEILGVVPFIATLGTQWVYRGIANVLINGKPIYTADIPSKAVQDAFYVLGGGRTSFWLPYSVIITAVYGVILAVILSKSKVGRQIYACGSNLEAAKLSGINAVGTRMFAYCVSGFSAALCGILVSSRLSSAQPTAGMGYELEAIAAAVLGGVSNNGGEGSIVNAMIGALIMGVLRNGLNLFRVNSFWQQAITGFLLVAACAVEARRHRQSA